MIFPGVAGDRPGFSRHSPGEDSWYSRGELRGDSTGEEEDQQEERGEQGELEKRADWNRMRAAVGEAMEEGEEEYEGEGEDEEEAEAEEDAVIDCWEGEEQLGECRVGRSMCGCRFRRWAILTGRRGLGKVLLGAVLLGRVLLGGVLLGGSAWLGGAVGTVEAAVEETVAGAVEGSALVEAAAAGVCTLRAAIFPPLLLLLVQLSPELEPLTASAEDREASVAEAGGVEAGEEWSGKVIWYET
ncbi:unnamed protein product [Closterium sp. NIES-64]|nr:unnamed protein product [Closterium sp. NIES-64]